MAAVQPERPPLHPDPGRDRKLVHPHGHRRRPQRARTRPGGRRRRPPGDPQHDDGCGSLRTRPPMGAAPSPRPRAGSMSGADDADPDRAHVAVRRGRDHSDGLRCRAEGLSGLDEVPDLVA